MYGLLVFLNVLFSLCQLADFVCCLKHSGGPSSTTKTLMRNPLFKTSRINPPTLNITAFHGGYGEI